MATTEALVEEAVKRIHRELATIEEDPDLGKELEECPTRMDAYDAGYDLGFSDALLLVLQWLEAE